MSVSVEMNKEDSQMQQREIGLRCITRINAMHPFCTVLPTLRIMSIERGVARNYEQLEIVFEDMPEDLKESLSDQRMQTHFQLFYRDTGECVIKDQVLRHFGICSTGDDGKPRFYFPVKSHAALLQARLQVLIAECQKFGYVPGIDVVPMHPLKSGYYKLVATMRPVRQSDASYAELIQTDHNPEEPDALLGEGSRESIYTHMSPIKE